MEYFEPGDWVAGAILPHHPKIIAKLTENGWIETRGDALLASRRCLLATFNWSLLFQLNKLSFVRAILAQNSGWQCKGFERSADLLGKKWQSAGTVPSLDRCETPTRGGKTSMIIRTIVFVTALALSSPALAQGVSEQSPGHKMQRATKPAPGASEYAPGHRMQNAKTSTSPGASEYAPGQQTTGSNKRR